MPDPGGALERFSSGYYRDPRPALAADALEELCDSGLLATRPEAATIFVRAVQRDPSVGHAFTSLAERRVDLGPSVSRLLALAASTKLADPSALVARTPEDLDYLWGEFLLTGDCEHVRRIASVLSLPDRTGRALAEWSASRPVLPWSKAAHARAMEELRAAGFSFESGTAADQDLVLWKLMSRGFQARVSLPFALTDDHILVLMLKGSACWSLQSNARQHEVVAALMEELGVLAGTPSFVD